ncbi:ArnT family glycosyltransferase [Lutimonas sp.]|uniref:ArnT family glycosyltransferase n=1 Tax=Lutimonas sp. TaxID=1872403 RepID=UPI003D9B62A2
MDLRKPALVFFILLKFVLQFVAINPIYELHRDEYLHLDLGNHLAWGYLSVPPVTSWISFLIISLGNSVFWVKFFPALFGALTIYFVWKTVAHLGGKLYALSLSALCITLSALLRINTLYQPNSFDFLFWTILFYTIIRYVQTHEKKWFWYAGIAFAFGFLNKYNISFLLLGLIPAILLSKQRHLFLNRDLLWIMALSLIIIAPNLWWQYQNDFPVIWHLSTLSDTQLVHVNRWDFLIDQLFFFSGAHFVLLAGFISFFWFRPFKKYKFLFWTLILVLCFYSFLRAKSYYAMGLYPVYIGFGAVYIEYLLSKGWKYKLRPVFLLIPILVIIPLFQLLLPVLSPQKIAEKHEIFETMGMLKWEDGKNHLIPQDYADMVGWEELAGIVDEAFMQVKNKEATLIHCDGYGMAGSINFYAEQEYTEALTMEADYLNWYPLDQGSIENVILVKGPWDDDPERKREAPLFDSVTLIGTVSNKYARDKGTKVYLLAGAKQDINSILKDEIAKKRQRIND